MDPRSALLGTPEYEHNVGDLIAIVNFIKSS